MLPEKLTRECKKSRAVYIALMLFVWGCEKDKITAPPVPQIHLTQRDYVIPDTSPSAVTIEIEASEYVGAYSYPVYFQLEGAAQKDIHFTTAHAVYTNTQGEVFYKAVMAQGVRKSAVVIQPLNTADGNQNLTIKFFPDQERNRYVLPSSALTATLTISDN